MTKNSDTLATQWLAWWCYDYWLCADPSWHSPLLQHYPPAEQQRLIQLLPETVAQMHDITPGPVAAEQPAILQISQLSANGKTLLLCLAAEVCQLPLTNSPLTPAQIRWCWQLRQGLQPARWLPGTPFPPQTLLHSLWPECWLRLRMQFPKPTVRQSPQITLPASAHRALEGLLHAILCLLQQKESPYVDHKKAVTGQ